MKTKFLVPGLLSLCLLPACGGASDDGSTNSSRLSGRNGNDDQTTESTTGAACTADSDCAAGQECEVEHGVGRCQAHRGDGGVDDKGTDDRGTDDKGTDDRGADDHGGDDRGTGGSADDSGHHAEPGDG